MLCLMYHEVTLSNGTYVTSAFVLLCGSLNGVRLELGQMLKFDFEYLLYILDK